MFVVRARSGCSCRTVEISPICGAFKTAYPKSKLLPLCDENISFVKLNRAYLGAKEDFNDFAEHQDYSQFER